MTVFHPGVTELEWLTDLKPLAEEIGEAILGHPVRWKVEVYLESGRRADVVVETYNGDRLFNGEAKRPDSDRGQHPLVTSEVDNAVAKAQELGLSHCFTTNFMQSAVLSARPGYHAQPLLRIYGNPLKFIDPESATHVGWWRNLSEAERRGVARTGLTSLFERYKAATEGAAPSLNVDNVALDYFRALTDVLLDPLAQTLDGLVGSISPAIHQRALTAGLNLDNGQDRRYLVAQGIAEVLTATLFHRVLRDYFSELRPLLGGTSPASSAKLAEVVRSSLTEAVRISGDYKPILVIGDVADWAVASGPPPVRQHWLALFDFIERIDVNAISSDILGGIFERLISPERRHDLGQHYTQPRLARAMARWGVTDRDTTVLDPACGAGTFLVETYQVHQRLGLDHNQILARNFGNDVDGFAVHLASINLVSRRIRHGLNHPLVREGDAFTLTPNSVNMLHVHAAADESSGDVLLPVPDLVITNPPYGRTAENEIAYSSHINSLGLLSVPETRQINLAAWFVLLGAALVKKSGRMAFVLPSAVLQNENLTSWRLWLRRRYDIVIWHTEFDIWFSDARVAPCVLLMQPRKKGSTEAYGSVKFVNSEVDVDGSLYYVDGVPTPSEEVQVRDLTQTEPGADLLIPGAEPDVLKDFSEAASVRQLGEVTEATVAAGQKLGHKVFRLTDAAPESTNLMRNVSGLGTTFKVNRKYLEPLLVGSKAMTTGAPRLARHWLLALGRQRPSAGSEVGRYLKFAESQNVHRSPSVGGRNPWWRIDARPVNIAVSMNQQFRHQVAWLSPPAVATNNFNTISMPKESDAELVAASMASAFGGLSALFRSGEVGCEGARRILLAHLVQWPTLDPQRVADEELRQECIYAYRAYRELKPSEYDEMSSDEFKKLQRLTRAVGACALSERSVLSDEIADRALKTVEETCARRRMLETRALGGRTRSTSSAGPTLPRRFRTWSRESRLYEEVLQLLTIGEEEHSLRKTQDIDKPQLFQVSPMDDAPDEEKVLTQLLGAGFEAAFPHPVSQATQLDELVVKLGQLVDYATEDLLPAAPPEENPGYETWKTMQQDLVATIRRALQLTTRQLLG